MENENDSVQKTLAGIKFTKESTEAAKRIVAEAMVSAKDSMEALKKDMNIAISNRPTGQQVWKLIENYFDCIHERSYQEGHGDSTNRRVSAENVYTAREELAEVLEELTGWRPDEDTSDYALNLKDE